MEMREIVNNFLIPNINGTIVFIINILRLNCEWSYFIGSCERHRCTINCLVCIDIKFNVDIKFSQ